MILLRLASIACSDGSLFSGRCAAHRRSLNSTLSANDLLHGDTLVETLEWILALETLKLARRVLVQELVDGQVSAAHLDDDFSTLDLDEHALGSELVDTFGLTHEHDLELLTVGIIVNVLRQLRVDRVRLDWDVNSDSGLQVNDVSLKGGNLILEVLDLLEELQTGFVSGKTLKFDALDVLGGLLELNVELLFVSQQTLVLSLEMMVFLNK